MATFKELAAEDTKVFLNTDEFADVHILDGKEIRLVVDTDTLNGKPLPYAEGVSLSRLIVYVDPLELGYRPQEGQSMHLDGDLYEVMKVGNEQGMYAITLEGNFG